MAMGRNTLVFVLLLAFAACALAQNFYPTSNVCNATWNKPVYKSDWYVSRGGTTTDDSKLRWSMGEDVDIPSKFCNCSKETWQVGAWKLQGWSASSTSYPISQFYEPQWNPSKPTTPYMGGTTTRAKCCNLCNGLTNKLKLSDGTIVDYEPEDRSMSKIDGKYDASKYKRSNSKVFFCAYWQHYIPLPSSANGAFPVNATAFPGCPQILRNTSSTYSPDACGFCIIYPVGSKPKMSEGTNECKEYPNLGTYRSGVYSTIGKGCPGGKNDPHFVGAQGTHFDFNGMPEESFCLISDKRFQVNMQMRGYYDKRTVGASILKNGMAVRTWIRDLAVVWLDESNTRHTFRMWARDGKSSTRDAGFAGGYELDGVAIPRLQVRETAQPNNLLTLKFEGYEKQGGGFFDVDVYQLTIPGVVSIEIKLRPAHPLLQTKDDAMTHINVRFVTVEHTPAVHGVLGQTFRPGREKRALEYSLLSRLMGKDVAADSEAGLGFLDGSSTDYKTSSVLSTDCKFSAFGGKTLPL